MILFKKQDVLSDGPRRLLVHLYQVIEMSEQTGHSMAKNEEVFVNDTYRGVRVPEVWIMTSKCAGKSCVSKLAADPNRALLQDVMTYENPDVEARICRDVGCTPEVAKQIFLDLKKFLWAAAVNSHVDMVPTPIIDEGWHCFVLFTEDYADFCHKYFGTFIHHTAHRVGEQRSTRVDLIPTIDAMHELFGGLPSQYWNYYPVESLAHA